MTTIGLHAPNDRLRSGELLRSVDLDVHAVLLCLTRPDDQEEIRYWYAIARALRDHGITMHVRIERRGDLGDVFEADEQRAAIVAYQPDDAAPTFGEMVASWSVGNESNVDSPALAPAQCAIGQIEMLSRTRTVCPKGTRRYVPGRSRRRTPIRSSPSDRRSSDSTNGGRRR